MKKNKISNEIMTRFYKGKASGEEIKMVLTEAEHDPDLMEEIEIMSSVFDQLMDIKIKKPKVHINNEKSKKKPKAIDEYITNVAKPIYASQQQITYLPMWRLAAQSKDYGQEMKAPNDCVVQCEQYILQLFNIESSIETLKDLSKKNRWLKEGGTPLHHIGRLLSEYQLSVVRRYDCDIDILKNELSNDCKIIVAVNSDKFIDNNTNNNIPNHAVVVLSVNEKEAQIYDPQNDQETSCSIDNFVSAWKDSHYYIVSVTERGKRQYNPAPIDASNFQLSDDLDELIEAIAENNHEIWAKDRKKEGIEYGPVRDEKHNPDMVPYSDLPKTEQKYDLKAAKGILELVQRLGYKITKE